MSPISTSRKQLLALCCTLLTYLFCTGQNAITLENQLPGVPMSTWAIQPDSFRAHNITGYSTEIGLNAGQTAHFKVTVFDGANFTMKIYRLGYYGGNGARLVADLGVRPGVKQPTGAQNMTTGLYDCSNWSESAQWAIPANAVSGLYIAKIDRVGGGTNHIVFIVRNDASTSDLYVQFPDATWQAYNTYGGSSTYDGTTSMISGHASKVSYNRPFYITNASNNVDGRGSNWYMNAEYPMVRWLERNGYDVTYTTCEDVSANAAHLLNHKVYVSVGHDEYVSEEQRNNVEAARAAGVHLAFFTGNEVYWKTRYENDALGNARHTLVCYKEGLLPGDQMGERACGSKCDVSSTEWTGLWKTGAAYDGGRPENSLTGQTSWTELPGAIEVPAFYKKLRFWRNTSVASLGAGQTATLAPNSLGYEWDYEQNPESLPAGRITMSNTTVSGLCHKLSLYRHSSGSIVFGAGTIQWSWGLDLNHYGGDPIVSKDMQQATVNLFADMGAQPSTLQSDLVAATISTDHTAPVSVLTAPGPGQTIVSRTAFSITGTASDIGGVVAAIEVSVDGGLTWQQATLNTIDGAITWSYSWIPDKLGAVTIKYRGVDDSGNKETAGAGVNVTVLPPVCPCTIISPNVLPTLPKSHTDNEVIELGVKFRPNVNGYITGVRFYKDPTNEVVDPALHLGNLWTAGGTNLAHVEFTNETASGWQEAIFDIPVSVLAGTTYVASYFSPTGNYSKTPDFFTQEYPNGPSWPIQALATPLNGVFRVGDSDFPTEASVNGENYFVDVIFNTSVSTTTTLNGTVTLQARPAAPNAQWQIPLQVDLYTAGVPTPVGTYYTTTNSSGAFTIPNVPIGTYNVAVKCPHTLRRVKLAQALIPGGVTIDFGTLLEGDVNNNNLVSFTDLLSILGTYGKSVGDPAYNANGDLNSDGVVNFTDMLIILGSYTIEGENP